VGSNPGKQRDRAKRYLPHWARENRRRAPCHPCAATGQIGYSSDHTRGPSRAAQARRRGWAIPTQRTHHAKQIGRESQTLTLELPKQQPSVAVPVVELFLK